MTSIDNWEATTIGKVSQLINGRAFKPKEWSNHGIPIIRIQNLNNQEAEFNYCNFKVDKKYYIENNDLLFAWSGTPGTSFGAHIWRNGKAVLNQHIFKIIIDEKKLNKKFFMHLLNNNVDEYIRKSHGTAGLAHITKGKFEESLIKIPHILEQQLIVQEIEKHLTRLDEAIKNLKSVKGKLKVYRKTVLKAAFDDKLIEIKDNWVETTLSEEFDIIMGQSPESKYYNKSEHGLPFFQGKKEFTELYAEIQIWSTQASKIAEKDDVLLSVRAPIGPVNLAPAKCGIGRGLAAIKPNDKTNSKLIFYLLMINGTELEKKGTGTTFRAITKPKLYSLPIRLPQSKEGRNSILQEIESRFSVIDKVEEVLEQSLDKAEMLRKSILKSAFEGKIVSPVKQRL